MDINDSSHLLIPLIRIMDINNSSLQIKKMNNNCSVCKAVILAVELTIRKLASVTEANPHRLGSEYSHVPRNLGSPNAVMYPKTLGLDVWSRAWRNIHLKY